MAMRSRILFSLLLLCFQITAWAAHAIQIKPIQKTAPKWAPYFNPYVSAGLGLDRALFFPAFGFRSQRVNVQVSFFDDLTASGMFSAEASVDVKTLNIKTKYRNVLSVGANYFHSYSGDISSSSSNIGGVLVGYNKYRIGGRHQFYGKIGVAYWDRYRTSYDLSTHERSSSSSSGFMPNMALGYHLFLFRME